MIRFIKRPANPQQPRQRGRGFGPFINTNPFRIRTG